MGFRDLRVINEDWIAPSSGFPMHSHRDMEIVTYIIDGELAHKDSTGGGSVIRRGDIQRMSAGRGITHSEFNPSSEKTTHLLQIWIETESADIDPDYEDKRIADLMIPNHLNLIVSREGRNGSAHINQDVSIYAALLETDHKLEWRFSPGRNGWVQMVKGKILLSGTEMSAGDGAAIGEQENVEIQSLDDSEFLFFDLR